MFLSVRHRVLFVHIAKTGGTSIRKALTRLHWSDPYAVPLYLVNHLSRALDYKLGAKFPRHAKAIAAQEMIGQPFFGELFKFTVVRNPWDLQVSSWHHLKAMPRSPVEEVESFREFLRLKFDPERGHDYLLDISSQLQTHHVVDLRGEVILDFIGRYERLEEDFAEACRRADLPELTLPHRRERPRKKRDWREYYDDETAELVARRYREDIERFGYAFDR